ncbi:MAG TPA: hypothetical protein ENN43_07025 [bacterium]|nr:hypothetical protein [bacterium]
MKKTVLLLLVVLFCFAGLYAMSGKQGVKEEGGQVKEQEAGRDKKEKIRTYTIAPEEKKEIMRRIRSKDKKEAYKAIKDIRERIGSEAVLPKEERERRGRFVLEDEILDEVMKFAREGDVELKRHVYTILARDIDDARLKEVLDVYLEGDDEFYKRYAIQRIIGDPDAEYRNRYKEKFIKMVLEERDVDTVDYLFAALKGFNDPKVVYRIKPILTETTEPIKMLKHAFEGNDINDLRAMLRDDIGFLLQIVYGSVGKYPERILSVEEAIEVFEGKNERHPWLNIRNLNELHLSNKSRGYWEDGEGRFYAYLKDPLWFGDFQKIFAEQGRPISSEQPILRIYVMFNFLDTERLPQRTKGGEPMWLYITEVDNKWCLIGMRN